MTVELRPWPWYLAGPAIGLMVPALLWLGNRQLGLASSLRHLCAAICPGEVEFFRYDWRSAGRWNLAFVAGVLLGGFIGGYLLGGGELALSPATRAQLAALGIHDFTGLAPREIFAWGHLLAARTLVMVVGGGFLVGFGTAWAGGCTSGHGISGLACLERASAIAVLGFFAGGLLATYFLLPVLLR